MNKHAGRRLHCPNSISLCCLPAIEIWREIPTEMVLEVHSASHRLRHRIARGGGECGAGWGAGDRRKYGRQHEPPPPMSYSLVSTIGMEKQSSLEEHQGHESISRKYQKYPQSALCPAVRLVTWLPYHESPEKIHNGQYGSRAILIIILKEVSDDKDAVAGCLDGLAEKCQVGFSCWRSQSRYRRRSGRQLLRCVTTPNALSSRSSIQLRQNWVSLARMFEEVAVPEFKNNGNSSRSGDQRRHSRSGQTRHVWPASDLLSYTYDRTHKASQYCISVLHSNFRIPAF